MDVVGDICTVLLGAFVVAVCARPELPSWLTRFRKDRSRRVSDPVFRMVLLVIGALFAVSGLWSLWNRW
ncbi:MAG: hypothetical protein U0Q03_00020 [Acidimicrobiales bacterium]